MSSSPVTPSIFPLSQNKPPHQEKQPFSSPCSTLWQYLKEIAGEHHNRVQSTFDSDFRLTDLGQLNAKRLKDLNQEMLKVNRLMTHHSCPYEEMKITYINQLPPTQLTRSQQDTLKGFSEFEEIVEKSNNQSLLEKTKQALTTVFK